MLIIIKIFQLCYSQSEIKTDTYIPPYACLELGYTYAEKKDLENAKIWIEKSRNEYSGFLVEAFIHLRAHGAIREISDLEKTQKEQTDRIAKGSNGNGNGMTDVPLDELAQLNLIDTTASSKIKRSNVLPSWMGFI